MNQADHMTKEQEGKSSDLAVLLQHLFVLLARHVVPKLAEVDLHSLGEDFRKCQNDNSKDKQHINIQKVATISKYH